MEIETSRNLLLQSIMIYWNENLLAKEMNNVRFVFIKINDYQSWFVSSVICEKQEEITNNATMKMKPIVIKQKKSKVSYSIFLKETRDANFI